MSQINNIIKSKMKAIENFLRTYKYIVIAVLLIIGFILINKSCESEPKIKIKTETKIVTKHDTITNVVIKEIPKIVYVERFKTIKGKDSIVYKDKPTEATTTANQYTTRLTSKEAVADLKVTTTGQLINIEGTIDYPEVTNTVTKTVIKDKSGLYVYVDAPLNVNRLILGTGLIYQFKNKILIKSGITYNDITKNADFNVGIGLKLF